MVRLEIRKAKSIGKTGEVGQINWKNHGPERRGSFCLVLERG